MDFREELVSLLPRLRRFATGLCGDMTTADDLVQEACGRAIERQHQWRPGTRLDSWMFRIIQNLYRDQIRASAVRNRHLEESVLLDHGAQDGARAIEDLATLGAVRTALRQLSPEQRSVLLMVCIEGLSYRETAEALDVPVGTVMSRLARARQGLNEALNGPDPAVSFPAAEQAR